MDCIESVGGPRSVQWSGSNAAQCEQGFGFHTYHCQNGGGGKGLPSILYSVIFKVLIS